MKTLFKLAPMLLLLLACAPNLAALDQATDTGANTAAAYQETRQQLQRLSADLSHQTGMIAEELSKTRDLAVQMATEQPAPPPVVVQAPPTPEPKVIYPGTVQATLDPDERTALMAKIGEHTATAQRALQSGIDLQQRVLEMSRQLDAILSQGQASVSTVKTYGTGGVIGVLLGIIGWIAGLARGRKQREA